MEGATRRGLRRVFLVFLLATFAFAIGCDNPLGDEDTRDSSFSPGGGGSGGGGGTQDQVPPQAPSALLLSSRWVSGASPVSSPIFTWNNPNDVDFDRTEVALGISIGGEELVPFASSAGASSHTFNSLSLSECSQVYYPSARAVDSSGNISVTTSEITGFRYDNTNPSPVGAVNVPANDGDSSQTPTFNWSALPGADNCGIDHYEIAIGYDDEANGFDAGDVDNVISWSTVPGGSAVTSYQIQDAVDGFSFTATLDRGYYTSIRLVDAAGLSSNAVSSALWYTFHPTQLSNLELWLDSSDTSTHFQDAGCAATPATVITDPVGCWRDKSGQTNHAIQAGGNQPEIGTTGIRFNGTSDFLQVAAKNYVAASDLSIFIFFEADTQSGTSSSCCRPLVSFVTSSPGLYTWLGLTRTGLVPPNNLMHGWNGSAMSPIPTTPGDLIVLSATHDGTNSLYNAYSFGLQQVVNHPIVGFTGTPLNIGGDSNNAARRYAGEIYEVVITESIVGNTERQKMEGYLSCKYDARDQLDPGHPYYDLVGANKSGCP